MLKPYEAALVASALALLIAMAVVGLATSDDPPNPAPAELQRQNAALRDSLEAERGWDTTPPGFIREICEVQNESGS